VKITIEYEASWRNSFLDGSNNESLPKEGRKFIGSMTNLKNVENYIQREITLDTVMGILNRLIGDQRKLYQSREDVQYFFKDIEPQVSFQDKPKHVNTEITYIRNITGSTDQNSYTGMIKVNDPVFNSDYSGELWSIVALDLDELCSWILDETKIAKPIELHPLVIIERLEELNKLKSVALDGAYRTCYEKLSKYFSKFKGLNKKGEVLPISLYCSALYLQLEKLAETFDLSSVLTKAGGLSGISNNGFTKKDFMSRYTTGDKKKIWGNPYMREEFVAGVGKSKRLLKKVNGQLQIDIDVNPSLARQIQQLIDSAGVSSFYLGKKGLAYVTDIRV
jgi:hypothetical protein